MGTQRVTDDLDRLLGLLPQSVQVALSLEASHDQLLEVVLDLGRIPEARYPGRASALGDRAITRDDLADVVDKLGRFGADNRAGIERTLHRISAIRNRQGEIVGLTCRVGRAVFGTVAMVRDLLDSAQSLLLIFSSGEEIPFAASLATTLAPELWGHGRLRISTMHLPYGWSAFPIQKRATTPKKFSTICLAT